MPGFSTTTTCPRTGYTDGSGTRSRAPIPVQFTMTGASIAASDVTGETSIVPPRAPYRVRRYSRYTGIVTTGAVYRQPETMPSGSSDGASSRMSGTRFSQSSGDAGDAATSYPLTCRIPADGSTASDDSTLSPAADHEYVRSGGPHRTGPQIAPAATDVVPGPSPAVTIRVDSPASASEMAVVSPTTPAPATTASACVMPPTLPGRVRRGRRRPRGRASAACPIAAAPA
jgi:hypothetical protein